MDKIEKFLRSKSKKERQYLKNVIFPKILNLDLKELKVKKINVYPLWRVRYKDIRILFSKINKKGIIFKLALRKDIYKNL